MRVARSASLTRALLRCGLAAGPVFLGTATAIGLRRSEYRAARHPLSSLALGGRGGAQVANFVIGGSLCLAFAAGLARLGGPEVPRPVPPLVALAAAGMLACGAFPADPVNGYPPGTPLTPEVMSRAGAVHLAASSAIMVGVPLTTALQARHAWQAGDHTWAGISAAATGLIAGSFAGACAGFAQVSVLPSVAGALQRVAVASGFGWLGALAVHALRRSARLGE